MGCKAVGVKGDLQGSRFLAQSKDRDRAGGLIRRRPDERAAGATGRLSIESEANTPPPAAP